MSKTEENYRVVSDIHIVTVSASHVATFTDPRRPDPGRGEYLSGILIENRRFEQKIIANVRRIDVKVVDKLKSVFKEAYF